MRTLESYYFNYNNNIELGLPDRDIKRRKSIVSTIGNKNASVYSFWVVYIGDVSLIFLFFQRHRN